MKNLTDSGKSICGNWCGSTPEVIQDYTTPFAVHYEKIRNHLRETETSSAKIHSLAHTREHLRINQVQLRFLRFNQHSVTLLGIHMRHLAYKREKYTFINANIKVTNMHYLESQQGHHNRQTLKCKHYSLTDFYDTVYNSVAFLHNLRMDKTDINALVQPFERSLQTQLSVRLHSIHKKKILN